MSLKYLIKGYFLVEYIIGGVNITVMVQAVQSQTSRLLIVRLS